MSFLPGTASLIKEIDKRLLVVLRDGRTLIGFLRSIDQYANLVLQGTVERIHVKEQYGDIHRGIFIVRGENVVLVGEIDENRESVSPLKEVSVDEIMEAQREEQEAKEAQQKKDQKAHLQRGLAESETFLRQDDIYA